VHAFSEERRRAPTSSSIELNLMIRGAWSSWDVAINSARRLSSRSMYGVIPSSMEDIYCCVCVALVDCKPRWGTLSRWNDGDKNKSDETSM